MHLFTKITAMAEKVRPFRGIILFCVLIFGCGLTLFDIVGIEGHSMLPLTEGKHIALVFRGSFGLFLPFSAQPIIRWSHPERGQVVLALRTDVQEFIIKRVSGIPGDEIDTDSSTVTIAGTSWPVTPLERERSRRYSSIPEDSYFLTGDNSLQSLDSRSYGPLPGRNIIGIILFFL